MKADYHPPWGDDNLNCWPRVLFWVGFEAGIGISMKFRYGSSNFGIFSMENRNFSIFVTPGLVEFDHPSLGDVTRRRRDDTGPYHPKNIYHPSFSRKPARGGPQA